MGFIEQLITSGPQDRYGKLGYQENPFPAPGEVRADVFVPRPELGPLQMDLAAFLRGRPQGAVWALQGAQGVGKSNFLRNVEGELRSMVASGTLPGTAFCFIPSVALTPARVVEQIAAAIGPSRFVDLLRGRPHVPTSFEGTDFGRFWQSPRNAGDEDRHAEFLTRWLSGKLTYKAERDHYGISAREKLPPAVSFPYLVGLVEMMQAEGLLDHIVLLLDEFEDLQTLRNAAQTEYALVLKTLLNAFNWKGLYVIIAGAPDSFVRIAERYPSLATRMRPIALQPVADADAAVALANEYKKAAARKVGEALDRLEPTPLQVREIFVQFKIRPVTQRLLLSELHQLVERKANLPSI